MFELSGKAATMVGVANAHRRHMALVQAYDEAVKANTRIFEWSRAQNVRLAFTVQP